MEEFEEFEINITESGKEYKGKVKAYVEPGLEGTVPHIFHITLNGEFVGVVSFTGDGWRSNSKKTPQNLLEKIGQFISFYYQ
jgi:hypothetical protein